MWTTLRCDAIIDNIIRPRDTPPSNGDHLTTTTANTQLTTLDEEVVLLVSVAAIRSDSIVTAVGHDALRFAQMYFYHQPVKIVCHGLTPRDKDVANTTQEERLHQLAHIRGTVTLRRCNGDSSVPPSTREGLLAATMFVDRFASETFDSVRRMFFQCNGDVARILFRGLAKLRSQLDCADPRPKSFTQLLCDVDDLAADRQEEETEHSDSLVNCTRCTSLLEVWQRFVCEGDALAVAPPSRHSWVPLKFLLPLSMLTGNVMQGYVHTIRLASSADDSSSDKTPIAIQISVMASLDAVWLQEMTERERQRRHPTATITIEPSESEWYSDRLRRMVMSSRFQHRDSEHLGDEANLTEEDYAVNRSTQHCYSPTLNVERLDTDDTADVSAVYTVVSYERHLFRRNKHTPSWYVHPAASLSKSSVCLFCETTASGGVTEKVFVVDVKAVLQNGRNFNKHPCTSSMSTGYKNVAEEVLVAERQSRLW